jgi:hypothetical protein
MRISKALNRWLHKGVSKAAIQCKLEPSVTHYVETIACYPCEIEKLEQQLEQVREFTEGLCAGRVKRSLYEMLENKS